MDHGVPLGWFTIYPDFAGRDQRREMVTELVAGCIDNLAHSGPVDRD
jgi:hypothetical protein